MLRPVFTQPPTCHSLTSHAAPLEVHQRVYGSDPHSFLYESLESAGGRGRYSFLGGRPRLVFRTKGDVIELATSGCVRRVTGDPLEALGKLMGPSRGTSQRVPFPGGAVGYLGYDMVRFCERLPDTKADDLNHPDSALIFPDEVIAFDHQTGEIHLFVFEHRRAGARLRELADLISSCPSHGLPRHRADSGGSERGAAACSGSSCEPLEPMRSNTTKDEFKAAVERAREYIRAGDIFQVVLSQRFDFALRQSPLDVYTALRQSNPSPYMYFLHLDGLNVLGSSPEILVKVEDGVVSTRPLAGTRPRGKDRATDRALAAELLADEKERAEHAMLVDLARNDIGRVCDLGTVAPTELYNIERYAHVMHLVSHVQGRLAPGRDAVDVIRATFPAGTVSGAPKVRAMEIIEELEPVKRGIYGGAIGYLSLSGEMDLCIAIRTIVLDGSRGYIQVGAGVVADSVPEREYSETLHKAAGMMRAVGAHSDFSQRSASTLFAS